MTDPALRGGHWLDTGEGLASVDPLIEDPLNSEAPRPAETPQDAAYREYIAHSKKCGQCRSPYRCPRGNELWNTYTAR